MEETCEGNKSKWVVEKQRLMFCSAVLDSFFGLRDLLGLLWLWFVRSGVVLILLARWPSLYIVFCSCHSQYKGAIGGAMLLTSRGLVRTFKPQSSNQDS